MTTTQTKWDKPISEWTDEEKKEYETFRELHDIWLSSRLYRRMSFSDFINKTIEITYGHQKRST